MEPPAPRPALSLRLRACRGADGDHPGDRPGLAAITGARAMQAVAVPGDTAVLALGERFGASAGPSPGHAGPGDDRIVGGDDGWYAEGQEGNDTMLGGDGNDDLSAGPGEDTVDGSLGDDEIFTRE